MYMAFRQATVGQGILRLRTHTSLNITNARFKLSGV